MKHKIIVLTIVISMFCFGCQNVFAAGPADQECQVTGSAWTTMIRTAENILGQTFKPTQNRLSRIELDLEGDANGTVGLSVWKDGSIVAFNTNEMVSEPNGRGSLDFYFNDVVLDTESVYKIIPIYSIGNTFLGWYYQTNCYANGSAYMGDTIKDYDFAFATYGFDYQDPVIDGNTQIDTDESEVVSEDQTPEQALDQILNEEVKQSGEVDNEAESKQDTGSAETISTKSQQKDTNSKTENSYLILMIMLVILLVLAIAIIYVKRKKAQQK